MIDLFYYFDKSTKRKAELAGTYPNFSYVFPSIIFFVAEFADFCGVEFRKAIHHINIRWLSLKKTVARALHQYQPLRSYFLSKAKF